MIRLIAGLLVIGVAMIRRKRRRQLIWGPVPIINNKYWSSALRESGWDSLTLMEGCYSINKREDYDLYFEQLLPAWLRVKWAGPTLGPVVAFAYIIRNAIVLHTPFSGGPLGPTRLWRMEAPLLRWAGIRTVILPYGSDQYVYSQVPDPSLRHALLLSYPQASREERSIRRRIDYWCRHADVVVSGSMVDGLGRWDALLPSMVCIDIETWRPKTVYSSNDGWNGPVTVLHTPNHRGFKGTEFLVQAVSKLREEGLEIELIMLERAPNDRVRDVMRGVDILAEQFISYGYGLSGIEGMASGLVVLCNLEDQARAALYRRYSFMNECPAVSTCPERLREDLRTLVTRPELRQQLGEAGRHYVEKYHSYEMAQYLFGSVYERILHNKDVSLMKLFHPHFSAFNARQPAIGHPLQGNHLPHARPGFCAAVTDGRQEGVA